MCVLTAKLGPVPLSRARDQVGPPGLVLVQRDREACLSKQARKKARGLRSLPGGFSVLNATSVPDRSSSGTRSVRHRVLGLTIDENSKPTQPHCSFIGKKYNSSTSPSCSPGIAAPDGLWQPEAPLRSTDAFEQDRSKPIPSRPPHHRSCVRAKFGRGHPLVETGLAERSGAPSRTLIRAALKRLAKESIVEPRRNQGISFSGLGTDRRARHRDSAIDQGRPVSPDRPADRIGGRIPERTTQVGAERALRRDRGVLLRVLETMADEGIVAKDKGHGWTFLRPSAPRPRCATAMIPPGARAGRHPPADVPS